MRPVENAQDVVANISRRALFQRVGAAAGGVALLLGTALPAEAAKMTQKEVGYQQMPKGEQSCSTCSFSVQCSGFLFAG